SCAEVPEQRPDSRPPVRNSGTKHGFGCKSVPGAVGRMKMTRAHYLVLTLALAFCTGIVSAQVPTGTPPFGSFGGGPDIINLANLNSHIAIPVLHKSGRGTDFTYDLSYDSSVWYPVGSSGNQNWQPVTN